MSKPYIYPNRIVTLYGKNENIKGGLFYQDRYNGTGGWTYYWSNINNFHVDCSDFYAGTNRSPETAWKKTVFTFNNDVDIVVCLYMDYGTDYIMCNVYCEYNGVYLETPGFGNDTSYIPLVCTTYFSNPNGKATPATVVDGGLNFVLYTSYAFSGNQPPISGLNQSTSIILAMTGGAYRYVDGVIPKTYFNYKTLESTNNVVDLFTVDEQENACNISWVHVADFTDTDRFTEFMKTAGKGTNVVFSDKEDPEDDDSHTGGGQGYYDPTSDPIDFPDLPSGGALETGVIKGYIVGEGSLRTFQQHIWDMNLWDITTQFQKLVSNPLDALISLHCLPLLPSGSTVEHIKLANFDTLATGIRIDSEYAIVDCGELSIKEYYGSALDFSPYTKVSVYLPFCGIHDLAIADIENATIAIKYYVDVLSGDCIAMVKCGKSILYDFKGNCKQQVPVTQATNNAVLNGIIGTGAIAVGAITGNAGVLAGATLTSAHSVASSKEKVTRSGELGGNAGFLGNFKPYLIFHRPKQSLANNFKMFKGYPSNITYNLSSLSGYTEVEYIELNGIGATDTEMEELRQILSDGVIL